MSSNTPVHWINTVVLLCLRYCYCVGHIAVSVELLAKWWPLLEYPGSGSLSVGILLLLHVLLYLCFILQYFIAM